ncbi:hypothetical protein EUTSA_v10004854mg [Eutrema salsugineum]|uniref:F-box domain-containing protein n=1 Tax=Eutrema salsugineum TaxID=72664 RepID=V4K692_EUTSA|nr:hypothetical protein EUTSA_v10004854mg [Eutrema salsugineum]
MRDCISKIISFTSPRDACVVASVSKTFESAAKSDIVWDKFVPPEYASLVPRSRVFSSKKELYFALCDDPVLIDDGKKSFWLEKASGKRCIMVSAMTLSITWGDNPQYWQWIPCPEARFERVAELIAKTEQCNGFEDVGIEAVVGVTASRRRLVCFDTAMDEQLPIRRRQRRRNIVKPEEREDGWMEVELGEFFNVGGGLSSDEIEMSALQTKLLHWKSGLIIQGIEFRPTKSQ